MQSLSSCSLDPSDLQQKHALLRGAATLRGRQTEEDTEPCCKDVIVPIHLDDAVVVQPHACLTHRHAPGQSQVDGLAEPRRQVPSVRQMSQFVRRDGPAVGPLLGCTYLGRTPQIVPGQLVQAAAT